MKNLLFFVAQVLLAILTTILMILAVADFIIYLVKDIPFNQALFICFVISFVATVILWISAYMSTKIK